MEALLSELPANVSEQYEKTLSRSSEEDLTNVKEDKTKSLILQIILAATRPLMLDEANYALTMALADDSLTTHAQLEADRWKTDFKATVKNLCGLIFSVYDDRLFFIHLTAREFLLQKPDPSITGGKWQGRFANPDSLHDTILRCCVRYLSLSEFPSRTIPLLKDDRGQYPLLEYAAANWVHHLGAQINVDSHILEQARHPSQHVKPCF